MKKRWFKRKVYGWGWYPATWQGWLVLGLYAAIMFTLASTVDESSPGREVFFMLVLPFVLLTAALIRICYKTGETPRFQWGEKKDYELIVFDLDGTLAESKLPIDKEMAGLLADLLAVKKVAIISGAGLPQLETQVLSRLSPTSALNNLYILPTNGAALVVYGTNWQTEYEYTLTPEEKAKIIAAFEQAFLETGYVRPTEVHGEVLEDRGSQITFSALGSTALTALKQGWDSDHVKRLALQKVLKKHLPEFSISIGGMTSIDVTRGDIDKAYGVKHLLDYLHYSVETLLFVGDALFPGGNDASVLTLGASVTQVSGVDETKMVIRKLIEKKL